MSEPVKWTILLIAAYLIGSIPFALIIGRARGVDVRAHGSGNVGASNVGRVLGRGFGMLCFFLDVCKGLGPTVAAGLWFGLLPSDARDPAPDIATVQMLLWIGVAFAAIIGHTNSIFLGFKGGKGVATGFGSLLGIYPHLTWPILGALVVWIAAVKLWRMISVASMLAAVSLPFWYLLSIASRAREGADDAGFADRLADRWPFALVTAMLAVLVIWKHRGNIRRIQAGTELRIGEPPAPASRPSAPESGPPASR